jgi:dTDP-4-amino-4,6-dideoxygalactose transaminase
MRKDYLPYYKPYIERDDVEAVVDCMTRGWLTTGPKVKEFEEAFASMSGVRHAVAVNSCTAALQIALVALGVGPGDEVIMPSLTFVAGAECVKSLGGEPVFCDIDESSLCITPETIKPVVGPRTKVVIPMHYGGQPGRIREITTFAHQLGISVLEDAAHGVGTLDAGRWAGSYSDAAAFSFYATKNITSAEGGMLLTNRDDIAEKARVLSLHGMDRDAWKRYMKGGTWIYDVIAVGYKNNLPDMTAALGLSQLRKLQALQTQRDRLASLYIKSLGSIPGIEPVASFPPDPDRHSWCVFAVTVDEAVAGISRDKLIDELRLRNIGTSVHFIPTHRFSAYRENKRGDLSTTDKVWRRILSLPLFPGMTESDLQDVVAALNDITGSARRSLSGTAMNAAG